MRGGFDSVCDRSLIVLFKTYVVAEREGLELLVE
jgi:hypothetical protein